MPDPHIHRINLLSAWVKEPDQKRFRLDQFEAVETMSVLKRMFNAPTGLATQTEISIVTSGFKIESCKLNGKTLLAELTDCVSPAVSRYPVNDLQSHNELQLFVPAQNLNQPKIWLVLKDIAVAE